RQADGEPVALFVPKHDFAHGAVIRQHADDELASEEVGELGRRIKAERFQPAHLFQAADMSNHPIPGYDKVCRHRRAHVAEADEANLALQRWTSSPCIIGSNAEGEAGLGIVLHWAPLIDCGMP